MDKRTHKPSPKLYVDLCVSLLGLALLPSVAGTLFVWQVFLVPELQAHAKSVAANVHNQLDIELVSLRKLNEAHEVAVTTFGAR